MNGLLSLLPLRIMSDSGSPMSASSLLSSSPGKHQALYKLRAPNWKDLYRERCRKRIHDGRFQLLDRFRKMDLEDGGDGGDDNDDDIDIDSIMSEEWQRLQFESSTEEPVEGFSQDELDRFTRQVRDELEEEQKRYWEGLPTKEDQRKSAQVQWVLHNQNQVVCFACKQFNVEQIADGTIVCRCGAKFETSVHIDTIKHNMKTVISHHSMICINQFPYFSIYKADNVVYCDSCPLFEKVF